MTFPNLLAAQIALAGDARMILDVGAHDGASTLAYLEAFAHAHVHAFEPQSDNAANARKALGVHPRCTFHQAAIGETSGTVDLRVNSHSGTHSLLPIGAVELWQSPQHQVGVESVPCFSLDDFAQQNAIETIDILGMDIQGYELAALRGAEGLLSRKAIKVLRLEVEFAPLYENQPLFWDVGAYLGRFGYGFEGLYDVFRHPSNPHTATWADAIFLAPPR